MYIFPDQKLSQTEMDVIADKLSDPAVKKYFHVLAYEAGRDIATGEPKEGESAENYLRRESRVKGRLDALNTLLSISSASQKTSS